DSDSWKPKGAAGSKENLPSPSDGSDGGLSESSQGSVKSGSSMSSAQSSMAPPAGEPLVRRGSRAKTLGSADNKALASDIAAKLGVRKVRSAWPRSATFEHQVWECPWTKALDDPRIQATNGLCSEAKAGFERQAGFWMRGLVPWDWTFGRVAEHALNSKTRIFGPWSNGVWVLPDQAIAATDGSGGEHSADPRLRRVGWGAVVSTAYAVWPIAWASGGVQGTQTVPRAELQALVWLAQNTSGTVDVAIDAAYVVKGVAKGPRFVHDNHMDLWSALWSAMRNRVGKINAFWTKSHCSLDQLEQGLAITWAFVLNHVADQLADEAAEKAQLPAAVVDIVRWIDARASKVQSRLLAASMLWLPDNPDTEVAPVPDSPLQA
ncbi:unnamed protein product, partial [Polarella glacialis]